MTPSATAPLNGTPSWLLFSEQSLKSHAVDDDASREGLDYAGSAKDWRTPASKWPLHPQGVGMRSSVDNQVRVDSVGPARMDMSVRQNGVDIT